MLDQDRRGGRRAPQMLFSHGSSRVLDIFQLFSYDISCNTSSIGVIP